MATLTAPTASMEAGARMLLDDPTRWTSARRKSDERRFWIIRGRSGGVHYCDATNCTCPSGRHRGCCSHQVAVVMKEAQAAARQAHRFVCTFPECGEQTEEPRTLCTWHAERQARLRAELGV